MLKFAKMPKMYWGEALLNANYVLNRAPTVAVPDVTPYERWYGTKPNVSVFKVFGCDAYAWIPKELRTKLEDTSEKLTFVGYDEQVKAYRLVDKRTGALYIRRDVTFNERAMFIKDVVELEIIDKNSGLDSRGDDDSKKVKTHSYQRMLKMFLS